MNQHVPTPASPAPLPDPERDPDLFDRSDDDEPDDDQPREPVVNVVGDSEQEIADAVNSDVARKSWVDALMPLLQQKPPVRAENRTVREAYDCMLIAVYDRMTRLMRSDLADPPE